MYTGTDHPDAVPDLPPSSEVGSRTAQQDTDDTSKWKMLLEQQNQNFMALLNAMNASTQTTVKLPTFDPDKNNMDARSWITTADICMADNPIQGSSLMIAISRALKGQASSWLSLISFPGMTWGEFKDIFIARFDCLDTPAAFLINLNNSSPKEGECLAAYSARLMTSLMARWKNLTTEQIAVSTVMAHVGKIENRVQRLAFTTDIENRHQLQKELKAISFLKRKSGFGERDAGDMKRFKPMTSSQPVKCFRCGKLGHKAPSCRTAPDTFKKIGEASTLNEQHFSKDRGTVKILSAPSNSCFNCGHVGHFASRCPLRSDNPRQEVGAGSSRTTVEKRVDMCTLSAPSGRLTNSGQSF